MEKHDGSLLGACGRTVVVKKSQTEKKNDSDVPKYVPREPFS